MFHFRKNERLCSRKLIEKLFNEGQSLLVYPVKVTFYLSEGELNPPAQALILVSRKRFRKAVHRNRIKRLLREAYRLEKHLFYQNLITNKKNCLIALSYVANNELNFAEIREAVNKALNQII